MSRTSYLRQPLAALLMGAALAASVVMAAVVLASPAWAATYTVTNNADSGAGSLRQAIVDANATTGVADTINSTLSGNSANSSESGGGIFNYQGTLEVSNSTLSGNSAPTAGGIYNAGTA